MNFMTLAASLTMSFFLLLGTSGTSLASPIGFAVDTNENLLSIDLGSPSATVIGNTGAFLEGLAISGSGSLFGTSDGGGLYGINSINGAATFIGNTGLGNIEGLAFYGNTLLGTNFTNPTTIYSIDTTTGAATSLVTTSPGYGAIRAMAIQGNTAFVTSDTPSFQSLLAINLTSGVTTDIGFMSNSGIYGLAFDPYGTLFGVGFGGAVYTIDTTTGAASLIGTTSGSEFFLDLAMGSTNVPEPATLALVGLGLAGMGFRRKVVA